MADGTQQPRLEAEIETFTKKQIRAVQTATLTRVGSRRVRGL